MVAGGVRPCVCAWTIQLELLPFHSRYRRSRQLAWRGARHRRMVSAASTRDWHGNFQQRRLHRLDHGAAAHRLAATDVRVAHHISFHWLAGLYLAGTVAAVL